MVGDQAPYLIEGMAVSVAHARGRGISLVLPQRATFEVVETEPVDQGPDGVVLLQAGGAVQRRAHRRAAAYRVGTRVVVMTADGAYVERAKD